MHNTLRRWLEQYGIEFTHVTSLIIVIGLIMVTAVIIHLLLHRVLLSRLEKRGQHSKILWLKVITQHKLFHRLAFTLQGVIVNIQAVFWLHPGTDAGDALIICAQMWVMLYALLALFSLLDTYWIWRAICRLPISYRYEGFSKASNSLPPSSSVF